MSEITIGKELSNAEFKLSLYIDNEKKEISFKTVDGEGGCKNCSLYPCCNSKLDVLIEDKILEDNEEYRPRECKCMENLCYLLKVRVKDDLEDLFITVKDYTNKFIPTRETQEIFTSLCKSDNTNKRKFKFI